MPTTPAGTDYTVTNFTNSGGDSCLYAVADDHASTDLRAVLYFHGAGGSYNQFMTLGAWAGMRNWFIDQGWVIIEGEGGGPQPWGNQASEDSYVATFEHVDGLFDLADVVFLARSMGGAVAARMYTDQAAAFSGRVVGLIENSGVQDLVWAYDFDSNRWTSAFNSAWGVSSKTQFTAAVAGMNPIDGPAAAWDGLNVLQLVGDADTTVPPDDNGLAMRAVYNGYPALDLLDVRSGGDHSSTNGSYFQTTAMQAFIAQVIGDNPPEPADPRYIRAESMYVRASGEWYAVTA